MTTARALVAAALLAVPLSASRAEARPVTASQLSAAPYGHVPIRSNRPEWEIYNGNQPGGSPSSGIVGYPGPLGVSGPDGRQGLDRRYRRPCR